MSGSPFERSFHAPYNECLTHLERQRIRQTRMRAILDAGDYAIETGRHDLIKFLHEFLEVDETAYKDGADDETS